MQNLKSSQSTRYTVNLHQSVLCYVYVTAQAFRAYHLAFNIWLHTMRISLIQMILYHYLSFVFNTLIAGY